MTKHQTIAASVVFVCQKCREVLEHEDKKQQNVQEEEEEEEGGVDLVSEALEHTHEARIKSNSGEAVMSHQRAGGSWGGKGIGGGAFELFP